MMLALSNITHISSAPYLTSDHLMTYIRYCPVAMLLQYTHSASWRTKFIFQAPTTSAIVDLARAVSASSTLSVVHRCAEWFPETMCRLRHATCKSGSCFPLIPRILTGSQQTSGLHHGLVKTCAVTICLNLYSVMVTSTLPSQLGFS